MNPWRPRLLAAVVVIASLGWLALVLAAGPEVRGRLALLTLVFVAATAAVGWNARARISPRIATSFLALGVLVHAAAAGVVVGADVIWRRGLVPGLAESWVSFLLGALGVLGCAFAWTRARGGPSEPPPVALPDAPEPPPAADALGEPLDWEALQGELAADPVRLRALLALRRIEASLPAEADPTRRVLHQEALRLRAAAASAQADDDDALSQAAALLAWGAQKLPELRELDVSDLLMAKAIADIRAAAGTVRHAFVDHRELLAIHPIDRATADAKCEERAQAARDALPLLRAHGMRLSEDLIAAEPALAAFRSVTGFQVIGRGPGQGYITFEGNGRREALQRAFGDEPVFVEVRVYTAQDPSTAATLLRRVERVRRWKGVRDGRPTATLPGEG